MKPASFAMHRPRALDEALELLAAHREQARLLAGGQTLVPVMNFRMATPAIVIDLNRVAGLAGIRVEDGWLCVGAMTRQKELLSNPLVSRHAPLVARAAAHIGHVQTRNRGTVGGSMAHADPSGELPLVAVTLEAEFHLRSAGGQRTLRASDFFKDVLTTALAADEILTEIRFPVAPEGTRTAFHEFARRHGDFAIAAAAAQFVPGKGLRAALGGVGPVPWFCGALCAAKVERSQIARAVAEEVARLEPSSDIEASAEYRRTLAAAALTDCLEEVLPQ